MKIEKVLEGRKNPALNVKKGVVQELRDFVDEHGEENYFVHFGNIHKLGLNPSPGYDSTPSGVYAYPLKYVMSAIVAGADGLPMYVLPYAGDYKYAYIFKASGLVVSLQDEQTCEGIITHIEDFVGADHLKDLYDIIKKGSPSNLYISNLCKRTTDGRYTNPGGAVYGLPYLIFADMDHYPEKQRLVKWNKLYSMLGITGLVDWTENREDAIIHINEPTQAVFFDSGKLQIVKVLENNINPTGSENNRDKTDFGHEAAARARTAGARKMFSRDDCREFVETYLDQLLTAMGPIYQSFMTTDSVKYEGQIRRSLVQGLMRVSFHTGFFTKIFDEIKNHFDFLGKMHEHAVAALRFDLSNEHKSFKLDLFEELLKYALRGVTEISRSTKKFIIDSLQKKYTNKVFTEMKDSIPTDAVFSKSELAKVKTVDQLNSFLDFSIIDNNNVDQFIKAFGKNRLADIIADMSRSDHEDRTIKMITNRILGVDQ